MCQDHFCFLVSPLLGSWNHCKGHAPGWDEGRGERHRALQQCAAVLPTAGEVHHPNCSCRSRCIGPFRRKKGLESASVGMMGAGIIVMLGIASVSAEQHTRICQRLEALSRRASELQQQDRPRPMSDLQESPDPSRFRGEDSSNRHSGHSECAFLAKEVSGIFRMTGVGACSGSTYGYALSADRSKEHLGLRGGDAFWGRSYPWEHVYPAQDYSGIPEYYKLMGLLETATAAEVCYHSNKCTIICIAITRMHVSLSVSAYMHVSQLVIVCMYVYHIFSVIACTHASQLVLPTRTLRVFGRSLQACLVPSHCLRACVILSQCLYGCIACTCVSCLVTDMQCIIASHNKTLVRTQRMRWQIADRQPMNPK